MSAMDDATLHIRFDGYDVTRAPDPAEVDRPFPRPSR